MLLLIILYLKLKKFDFVFTKLLCNEYFVKLSEHMNYEEKSVSENQCGKIQNICYD